MHSSQLFYILRNTPCLQKVSQTFFAISLKIVRISLWNLACSYSSRCWTVTTILLHVTCAPALPCNVTRDKIVISRKFQQKIPASRENSYLSQNKLVEIGNLSA